MTTSKPISILYIGNRLSGHGLTPTNVETLGPRLEQEGYRLDYASSKRYPVWRLADMLWSIVRNAKHTDLVLIDTYSTSAFYYAWLSSLLCRMMRLSYVPILHGGKLPYRISSSPVVTKQLFNNSLTNVVISGYLQQCLEEKGFKNSLIPNNINVRDYPFLHRTHITPRLLWVRAFHETYNPQMAIKVLAGLLGHHPDATLTMVGPDKDGSLAKCQALAMELGIADKIQFTGKLTKEQWISLSKDHDIFINTTNFDNLPISIIEAMALGLPVVTTNVGGIPYLVEESKDGILISPDRPDEMASAIISLLNSREKAASLSHSGRRKAETFDWQIIKQKWNGLFNSICNS